jgi:hypothetical protein
MEDGQRAVLLRVVQRQALLEMGARKGQLSHQEIGGPERVVRLQPTRRVVSLLRQLQTLLSQLAGSLVRAPTVIELPESPQDREELRRLARALTELPRSGIRVFRFGGGKALGVHQRRAQGDL